MAKFSRAPRVLTLIAVAVLSGATWLLNQDEEIQQPTPTQAPAVSTSATPAARLVSTLPACSVDTLPEQADMVIEDILSGGPFEYPSYDGSHFGNYEGILPRESSSYYREYTVDSPRVHHRGPRRIVVGGGTDTDPDVWYYTDDHYESFCEIPDAEE